MCGICGQVSRQPQDPRGPDGAVAAMQTALTHRGPDGAGEHRDGHVHLAMRRLAIIDLEGGWQPLWNEDRSLALVANGEIYNYLELRQELQSRGHVFATKGDCETILHLYEELGPDCVTRLRGMFAFALWDARRRRLLLARDRMGEKPLYLFETDDGLLFSSELASLMASGRIPLELDPAAAHDFFHYQYVPEPATPIRGVRKLPPACRLLVDVAPWTIRQETWWRLEDAPPLEPGDDNGAARLAQVLDEVHRLSIRADVPVGLALSGGLDSSAVAALAARYAPATLHAFSVGYPGRPGNDERADAKALADHLGLHFHEVELEETGMADQFADLVFWRDDPIADISGWGYYSVQRAAREAGVPVMLQGQGGDELFWGYTWTVDAARRSLRKQRVLARGWRNLLDYWPATAGAPLLSRPGRALELARQDAPGHPRRMFFVDLAPDYRMAATDAAPLYASRFREQVADVDPARHYFLPEDRPDMRADVAVTGFVCKTYLLENGIAQGDRLSMASSIELRLPLVDHVLVETAVGLRKALPDHDLPPKARLKAALAGTLPDWVMSRPKQGFAPPVRQWHDALFARHGHLLPDGFLVNHGVLTPEAASALAKGPFPDGAVCPLSFKALVLEIWARRMETPGRREGGL